MKISFDNSYAALPAPFYARQMPARTPAPQLLAWNDGLAADLGITRDAEEDLAEVFSGNALPQGADPIAQAYAGHQFGGFSPQLGDGRAVLLGEVIDRHGTRRDIVLKGSGRTPFSRGGDGFAWLGPVLREYLLSEAMHALGVPTTRALAAVATGTQVMRATGSMTGALPGAVLTRVASSHLRVGTFQYFAARQMLPELRQLYEYASARHAPDAGDPHEFLKSVIARQAELVAHWLSLGFIHGVMNTDNTSISGETIDYGPCAFMDVYHPVTVFSSIDTQGRYAYDNQSAVIPWNMAQLASSLIPLMPDQQLAVEIFTETVNAMPAQIETAWTARFRAKLGLRGAEAEDHDLITDFLALMQANQSDFTNTFRALGSGAVEDHIADRAALDAWRARWHVRLALQGGLDEQGAPSPETRAAMSAVNPALIPRNHRIEAMIASAVEGDMGPFHRLMKACSAPFSEDAHFADLMRPPAPSEVVGATYCGT